METNLATLIAGLGGAAVGGFITYLGAVRIAKRNSRSEANLRFYRVFAKSLARFAEDDTASAFSVLSDEAGAQMLAAQEFRFHLSKRERRKFDAVWREYYGSGKVEPADEWFPRQYNRPGNGSMTGLRDLALCRIAELLKFTR